MTDPRLDALRAIIVNLEETPADQDEDFLTEAANLASRIKGLAETEVLLRALSLEADRCGLNEEGGIR